MMMIRSVCRMGSLFALTSRWPHDICISNPLEKADALTILRYPSLPRLILYSGVDKQSTTNFTIRQLPV